MSIMGRMITIGRHRVRESTLRRAFSIARTEIERKGWVQNRSRDKDGRICADTAMTRASHRLGEEYYEAMTEVLEDLVPEIRDDENQVIGWNDDEDRKLADITEAFARGQHADYIHLQSATMGTD